MSFIGLVSNAQRLLAATAIATCALAGAANAAAIATLTFSPVGLPAATGPVNAIDLTGYVGQNNFTINSGANAVTITAANGGAVVQGNSSGNYAAPVTGGTTAAPTYWTSPYLSSGGAPGSITMSFATPESYFGLLWGSIGSGDLLSFIDASGATIASVTGTQAMTAAAGVRAAGAALLGNKALRSLGLEAVAVARGTVELRGWVPSRATRALAARVVRAVPGIETVTNNILVRGEDDLATRPEPA